MKLLVIALASIFVTSPAFAGKENCKDVKIIVTNESDRDIKVLDLKYFDSTKAGDKWRNENGVAGKVALEGNVDNTVEYTRNLEEVLNDPEMKVKVRYKISKGGKWKDPDWSAPSPEKTCTKGEKYYVTVD